MLVWAMKLNDMECIRVAKLSLQYLHLAHGFCDGKIQNNFIRHQQHYLHRHPTVIEKGKC